MGGEPSRNIIRNHQVHDPLEAMAVVAMVLTRLLKADDQTTIRQVIGDQETFRAAAD
jgi:hypothetical protein